MKNIIFLFFLMPLAIYSQVSVVKVTDEVSKKLLIVQVMTDKGSFLMNTDNNGMFQFNKSDLLNNGVKNLVFSNSEYEQMEYSLEKLPETIFLKKIKYKQIETVVLNAKKNKNTKYMTKIATH